MWVMTTKGFYSVVETKDGKAMVRGRARADLEALVAALVSDAPVLETMNADYPFRVIVPKDEWARFLSDEAKAIDYTNFKSEVTKRQGRVRHDVYMRIWSALHGIEDPRPARTAWSYTKPELRGQVSLEFDDVPPINLTDEGDALLEKCACDHRLADHGDDDWLDHFDAPPHALGECTPDCPTDLCQIPDCLCDKFTELV